MKNNKHCKCIPRCYYLHRMENKIMKWKQSRDYRTFELTYEYLRIQEQFNWQTKWKSLREVDENLWGIASIPLRRKTHQTHVNIKDITR